MLKKPIGYSAESDFFFYNKKNIVYWYLMLFYKQVIADYLS